MIMNMYMNHEKLNNDFLIDDIIYVYSDEWLYHDISGKSFIPYIIGTRIEKNYMMDKNEAI